MIVIEWMGEAKGIEDVFSPTDFFEQGIGLHPMRYKASGKKIDDAKFILKAEGSEVELTYPHKRAASFHPGTYKLLFYDDSRTALRFAEWIEGDIVYFSSANGDLKIVNEADIEFSEGSSVLKKHLTRERDRNLRRNKLASVPHPVCEACGHSPEIAYEDRSSIEVHHNQPMDLGERTTALKDVAILCANCHRAIHSRSPMPSVETFRKYLQGRCK